MARTIEELEKSIAYFSHTNQQIIDELIEADRILRQVGFEDGLKTVKEAAFEIIQLQNSHGEVL